ncbi:MAG: flagellar hook-length control protein [Fibrobacteres bacterium]|nr:flagellar hook-length control protein [Fibrobacterota bacterium]
MLQAPNLLDMFANNRKDALAKEKAAQSKLSADAKNRSAGQRGGSDLLPLDNAGVAGKAGKAGNGKAPSFQAKIKESRANLAAKVQNRMPQDKTPETKPVKAESKPNAARAEARQDNRADHADKADKAERNNRANQANHGKSQSRAMREPGENADEAKPVLDKDGVQADGNASLDNARIKPMNDNRDLDEASEEDQAAADQALKQGLEDAGIFASEEQLRDPNVLADILQMIQNLMAQPAAETEPVQAEIMPGSDGVEAAALAGEVEGEGEGEVDTGSGASAMTVDATDAEPAPEAPASLDPKQPQAQSAQLDRTVSQKEVAALIMDRMAKLAGDASAQQTSMVRPETTPVTTPAGWQGVKVRPQTESIMTDPLPMADLDRLRVMQASALQAAASGRESEKPSFELPGDSGTAETAPESGIAQVTAGDRDSATAEEDDAKADLFGRNGDTARNAETSARKEGPLVAKDGATGPQFHATLDQARSVEHRPGVERAWQPRPAAEAGVMDQIAKKMTGLGRKDGDEISIQLSPEHLGKVRVALEMKEGAMSARISVENDNVRQQVEAGLAGLRDSLENQGIKLQGLEVSVDQRQSSLFNPDGSNSESFFHRNGRGAQGANGIQETAPFESAPESDTGRRLGYNTMEYIG